MRRNIERPRATGAAGKDRPARPRALGTVGTSLASSAAAIRGWANGGGPGDLTAEPGGDGVVVAPGAAEAPTVALTRVAVSPAVRFQPGSIEVTQLYAALERHAAGLLPDALASLEARLCGTGEAGAGGRGPSKKAPRVIGITSAVAGEGKSTVALHLASYIARNTFHRVGLLDMSMGADPLCSRLGLPEGDGIVPVLEGAGDSIPTLELDGHGGLCVLPAGGAPANPVRAAHSPAVVEVLAAAREMFDLVIVDMPAVSSGYALPLTVQADALIMVVAAGVTPREVVTSAVQTVGADRTVGVVLNRTRSSMPAWLRRRLAPSL